MTLTTKDVGLNLAKENFRSKKFSLSQPEVKKLGFEHCNAALQTGEALQQHYLQCNISARYCLVQCLEKKFSKGQNCDSLVSGFFASQFFFLHFCRTVLPFNSFQSSIFASHFNWTGTDSMKPKKKVHHVCFVLHFETMLNIFSIFLCDTLSY